MNALHWYPGYGYYSQHMSALTLVAVYKATLAVTLPPTFMDFRQVDALNYAVRRGIVFG